MNTSEPACAIPDLGPDPYAQWRALANGGITERLERQLILELLGDVEGCLDVGCGYGEFTIGLAKRGAIVVGIDASTEMIDAAKRRPKPRNEDISFQVARAEHLPFPDGQFDIVTAKVEHVGSRASRSLLRASYSASLSACPCPALRAPGRLSPAN